MTEYKFIAGYVVKYEDGKPTEIARANGFQPLTQEQVEAIASN